ncbi:MAG TPA: glycosyltransferase family 9 protein [Bryobacteraceae bacterium]|nr:glycosyltransferase family 9 protein [Bryobacteraceae bacterium]
MERVLEALPRGSRVAIVRLRSLGDCVLTTPALRLLKEFRPDLSVAVVVEDRFREIFEGSPDLEAILPPALPSLRRFRPLLCLNLHGGPRSAWFTALSGARWRAGFGHFRHRFAYNLRIPRAQQILGEERKVHTAEHLASAMFYLGAPRREIPPAQLGPPSRDRQGSVAVVHPFAAHPAKTWPAQNFVQLARHLEQTGLQAVIIGGPTDDFAPFRAFRNLQAAPLSEIKSLLAAASLFVGNDSGPAHMAAAFAIPSVVLFSVSDPEIWGPWRAPCEVLSAPQGIHAIPVARVLEALARLRVPA